MAGLDRQRVKMVCAIWLGWGSQGMLTEFWGAVSWKKIIWKEDDNIKIDVREVDCEDVGAWMWFTSSSVQW